MKGFFLALFLLLASGTVQFAQEPPPDTGATAAALTSGVSPLRAASVNLPDGSTSWVIRVIRTGGFAGVMLDIEVSSEGRVACKSSTKNCAGTVTGNALRALAPSIDPNSMQNNTWSLTDACRDCFVTRITVQHRDSEGKVQTYFAYWDDVTAARVPSELVRLASSVVSLNK